MWFVGSFDPVLELVIFGLQKLGDLYNQQQLRDQKAPCISRSAQS